MALSGVSVNDEVVAVYNDTKIGHKHRYFVTRISDNKKEIIVDKTVDTATWEEFVAQLPPKECRYAVFDMEYDVGEGGQRQTLVFVVWCPDTAKVQDKMLYAASKDAVKKKLVGLGEEIQATETGELHKTDVIERLKSKKYK